MALVDVLDFIPKHEAGRDSLLAILDNVAVQVKKLQDPKTGGWYQVMDRSGDKGNIWNHPVRQCSYTACLRQYVWDISIRLIWM